MSTKDLQLVAWTGALGRVLRWRAPYANERPRHQLRFRRGFLSGCRIDGFSATVKNAPEWSTVEIVDVENEIESLDGFDLRSLRGLGGLSRADVDTVVESRLRDQLVAIGLSATVDKPILDRLIKLPNLQWLMVSTIPSKLAEHPLFKEIHAVVLDKEKRVAKALRARVEIIAAPWLCEGLCLPHYNTITEHAIADEPGAVAPLLRAVHENPRDLPTLEAYGNYLTDKCDVRGEFIALQCARTRTGGKRTKREAELYKVHHREWLGRLDEVSSTTGVLFENGFVSALRYSNKNQASVTGLDEWRTLRSLTIGQRAPDVADVVSDPVLAQLERLECSDFELQEILGKKRRHLWTSLRVSAGNLGYYRDDLLEATLPKLTTLDCNKANVGAKELSRLLDSPLGRRLKHLRCKVWKEVASIEKTTASSLTSLKLDVYAKTEDKRPNWLLTFTRPPKIKLYTQLEIRHVSGKPPKTTRLLFDTLATVSGKGLKTVRLIGIKSIADNKTVGKKLKAVLQEFPGSPLLTL